MSFDDFIKQLFKSQYGDAVKSEISVGTLEKSFNLWVRGDHPVIQSTDLIPGDFKNHKDNIIEYKSGHDHYSMSDILKLLGDCLYFCHNQGKNLRNAFRNACAWFLVVNPEPFLSEYEKNGIKKTPVPGHYYYPHHMPELRIIVINELEPDTRENSLLLLLSSGERFRDFLKFLLENDELARYLQKYLRLKFFIEHKELGDMAEVRKIKKKYSFEENIRAAVEDIGIEKLVEALGIEKILEHIDLDALEAAIEKKKSGQDDKGR